MFIATPPTTSNTAVPSSSSTSEKVYNTSSCPVPTSSSGKG